MNKKLGLAVAGALVAFSSAANAGITIPAGDWTVDIGGVVNAYYTNTKESGDFVGANGGVLGGSNATNRKNSSNITTGLLPNYLIVSGKTRQNDLDVGFTISINPGASTTASARQSSQQENRQAFLTVGDASWGSVKLGKDLGIYASDAILNDMTLLGVGSGAGILAGNTTTLGRIGTGFMYADWKSQIAYTTPNWNGLQATVGLTQPWNTYGVGVNTQAQSDLNGLPVAATGAFNSAYSTGRSGNASPAWEGKVSYAFTADQVTGKVWASGITQQVKGLNDYTTNTAIANAADDTAEAWDIGATVNFAGASLTGYYGEGSGMGTTVQLRDGFDHTGTARDSKDWYLQATYVLPTIGTKVGVSYGESQLDGTANDAFTRYENNMWTVGAYHPLTKSVNLVAEYSNVETKITNLKGESETVSLGAILFF